MITLEEFNEIYFDGGSECHPAGYSQYDDTFDEQTLLFYQRFTDKLENKTVVELGCAKGFRLKHFQNLGVDITGIEISSYAVSKSDPSTTIIIGDVHSSLSTMNPVDTILSFRLLPCFNDTDAQSLLALCDAKSSWHYHLIDSTESYETDEQRDFAAQYYNVKPLSEWQNFTNAKGLLESV